MRRLQRSSRGFTGADYNDDGVTDVSDAFVWNNNKFTSATCPAPAAAEGEMLPPDPIFEYNPATGEMRVISEHWLIGMIVEGPVPLSTSLPGCIPDNGRRNPPENPPWEASLWGATYFSGKLQCLDQLFHGLIFTDVIGEPGYLPGLVFATYEAGLGAGDFGQVEWNASPTPTTAAGGFVDVIIIPEPGTMALLAIGALGVLARRRRK